MRHFTGIDKLINSFDQALRSLVPGQLLLSDLIQQIQNLHNYVLAMLAM